LTLGNFKAIIIAALKERIMIDLGSVWTWALIGIVLIGLELATATFYIMCFGISALLVAVILSLVTLGLNAQLIIFSILSEVTLGLWHFRFKGKQAEFFIGQSLDDIAGKVGVMEQEASTSKLVVRFNEAVMGSRTWLTLCDEQLEVGNEVKVLSVDGNYLRVEKVKQ
jgi:membrane protein implicated in regulation of membrane protease activity